MARATEWGNGDPPGWDRVVDGELARLLDEARAEGGRQVRRRERWLRARDAEELTWFEVCRTLAEQGEEAILATSSARHRGRIVGVGADFVAVRPDGPGLVLLADHALHWVRPATGTWILGDPSPAGGAGDGEGTASPASGRMSTLREVLADLAADRPTLGVVPEGASETVTGELRWVGADVVVLAIGERYREALYLRLSSVAEVSLNVSG